MLSPIVVCLQFYAFRLLGASFDLTVILLVFVNLPTIYFIWKRRRDITIPDRNSLLGGGVVLIIAVACLAPQLLDDTARMFNGHAWMHADVIYMLRNGDLLLQDPELAGIRMAYPWAGHVYQGILSFLLDSAPTSSYIWTNLVWLLCFLGFTAYIVAEFSSNRFSQITSYIWLCLGLNFVGYILMTTLPAAWVRRLWIGGDYRYTPWVLKFYFFEQIIFGLGMFAAVVYFSIREWNRRHAVAQLIVIGLLLCGIGLVYPILIAPSVLVVSARAFTMILEKGQPGAANLRWHGFLLGLVVLISGIVTFAYLELLTTDRVSKSIIFLSPTADYVKYTLLKSLGTIVAMSVFIAAFLLVIRTYWQANRTATFVLATGAVGSIMLNFFLEIPYWGNEYKFLFTAAICLAPFPSLVMEPIMTRLKHKALPVFAFITLILAAPFVHKLNKDFPWRKSYKDTPGVFIWRPVVNSTNFELTLDKSEPLFELSEAIRLKTTTNTLLVIERSELHFPTVTQRRLYAPPDQEDERQGVNIESVELLANIRGYGKAVVADRRSVVSELFMSGDTGRQMHSLERILQLNEPIAIVLEIPRHAALRRLLEANGKGVSLFNDGKVELWHIAPVARNGMTSLNY